MTNLELSRLRQDTPGCEKVLHFNNAGAALMAKPAVDKMFEYLQLEQSIGGYETQNLRTEQIDAFYINAAKLIGCDPGEIAFTEGASKSWGLAFYGLKWNNGDRVITGLSEYSSNYLTLLRAKKQFQIEIDVIENDEFGQISIEKLRQALTPQTKLIAITHVPTSSGLINPVEEIGEIAKESGVLYFVDTCQSIGQMPVSVDRLNCDMLCATGRKFLRGPRGTGFLFLKKELIKQMEPMFIGVPAVSWTEVNQYEYREDGRKFECFEKNYGSLIGLSAAIEYHLELGLDKIWARIGVLSKKLTEGLNQIEGVKVLDPGLKGSAIVTFVVDKIPPAWIHAELQKKSMNTSVVRIEFARLDMQSRGIEQVVRASIHYYNSEAEIEDFCNQVKSFKSVYKTDD